MPKDFEAVIEWKDPHDLTPYPFNNKLHPSEQIDKVAGSIAEFGVDQPLVIDSDGVIIKGHARREAALRLGLDKVPVVVRNDLSEAQKKASRIADNKTAVSDFDEEAIALELEALKELEYDLSQTGFSSDEIDELLKLNGGEGYGDGAGEDEDDVPDVEEVQPREGLVLGSIWQLGRHKIGCLDSTDEVQVRRLLGDRGVDMIWADPPYGISLESATSQLIRGKGNWKSKPKNYAPIINDDKDFDYQLFCWLDAPEQFWWGGDYYAKTLPDEGSWLVWDKRVEGSSDNMIGSMFELCWSKTKHRREIIRYLWVGILGTESQDVKSRIHPAQKPVQIAEWIFDKYGKPNDLIFDPFLGSGMSIIAAQKMEGDRIVIGAELSPIYCEVILQRFFNLTQIEPELIYSP